jgi:tRNA dimethylallyltransferase
MGTFKGPLLFNPIFVHEHLIRMKTLLVVLGPTGVGKSAISIQLARYFQTHIISADSRQFFRELCIGTAVPSADDLAKVPHHFIQNKSIHHYYNVSEFEVEALQLIDQLFQNHNPLILTGGSMLYIDTICKGIDDIPTVDPEIRVKVVKWYEQHGLEALQQRLMEVDPEYYRIVDLNNPKRLLHAVEIFQMTGEPLSSFRKNTIRQRPFRIIKVGINQERQILYDRINQRVDQMMADGLLEEVRIVYPYRELNSLNTVGYKELFAYLDGTCSLEEAVDLVKRNSRRYARKQLTWFRRDQEITWFEPEQLQEIIEFVNQKMNEHD